MIENLDQTIFDFLQSLRTPLLTDVMFFFTKVGNVEGIVLILLALLLGVIWWRKKSDETYYLESWLLVTLGTALAALTQTSLKLLFSRTRPELENILLTEVGYSFPSGHALVSITLFFLIAYFFLKQKSGRKASALKTVLITMPFMIGLSRIFLGVHWPSDVLGGFVFGAIIVFLVVKLDKLLRR